MTKVEPFIKLQQDLDKFRRLMSQAADVIMEKDVSNYPIFVAHQQEMELGMVIHDKEKNGGQWSIHASTIEEFVSKQIIFEAKVPEFKKNYKDPKEHVCVFILSELGAQFAFLPRK